MKGEEPESISRPNRWRYDKCSNNQLYAERYDTLESVCVSQMCKFLVSLSKDFSSYYNRVHVLGVSSYCVIIL